MLAELKALFSLKSSMLTYILLAIVILLAWMRYRG